MLLEDSLILLDALPEAYVRLGSDLRIMFINQAAQVLLRKTQAELLGKTLPEVAPLNSGAHLQDVCHRTMAQHSTVRFEHYSEPEHRWYVITVTPVSGSGIIVQFSDITDRKTMEDALRQSEEKFSKVFHSSPAPMCLVDIDRNARFLEVNEAFERITGYRRDEIIGHTSTELGLYKDLRDLQESRRRLLTEGGYRNVEFRFCKK